MKYLIILMFAGCVLDEEYNTGPGINKIPYTEETETHSFPLDTILIKDSYYHYYRIEVLNTQTNKTSVELMIDLGLGNFFEGMNGTTVIDSKGIIDYLAPELIPVNLLLTHHIRTL